MSKRKSLGEKLSDVRQRNGVSIAELASEISYSKATIAKIESGTVIPTLDFVAQFSKVLNLSAPDVQVLEQYTTNFLSEYDKWHTNTDDDSYRRPDQFEESDDIGEDALSVAVERESGAALIEAFQLSSVFALLQTQSYTRQILSLAGYNDPDYVNVVLAARVERQKALLDTSKRFSFVMNESTLRCGAFSKEVMLEQLDRFEELSKLPNVSIRFVPLGRMVSIHSPISFTMFDRKLTVIEGVCQTFKIWTELENKVYADLFDKLYREAVSLDYLLSMPSQKVYQPLAQL